MSFKLSLNKGRPIARVVGGNNDGTYIYLYDEISENKCCYKCSKKCLKKGKKCCKFCQMGISGGCGACNDDTSSDSDSGSDNKKFSGGNTEDLMFNDTFTELRLKNSEAKLVPVPNIERRESTYASSPSGGGKSYFTNLYIEQFKEMFPDYLILLFSRKPADPILDQHKELVRMKLDENILIDPIDPVKELENSLLIFDDVDTLESKLMRDELFRLRNDILEIGRAKNTYIITTSHIIANYSQTRTVLNEADNITIFPQHTIENQMIRLLDKYCGFTKEQIEKIKNLQSRWVSIYKKHPKYILYEKGIILKSAMDD